jgi:hypothetical protein
MPILRLLKTAAFYPKETKIFASAFDTAWNVLRRSGSTLAANDQAAMTREMLAKQIVEMGQAGERDFARGWPTACEVRPPPCLPSVAMADYLRFCGAG